MPLVPVLFPVVLKESNLSRPVLNVLPVLFPPVLDVLPLVPVLFPLVLKVLPLVLVLLPLLGCVIRSLVVDPLESVLPL